MFQTVTSQYYRLMVNKCLMCHDHCSSVLCPWTGFPVLCSFNDKKILAGEKLELVLHLMSSVKKIPKMLFKMFDIKHRYNSTNLSSQFESSLLLGQGKTRKQLMEAPFMIHASSKL